MERFDEYIVLGDTIEYVVSLYIDGVIQDITGATVFYTVKENKADMDSQAKILSSGVASGTSYLVSTSSSGLENKSYFHEIRVKLPTGKVFSRQGRLFVEQSIRNSL